MQVVDRVGIDHLLTSQLVLKALFNCLPTLLDVLDLLVKRLKYVLILLDLHLVLAVWLLMLPVLDVLKMLSLDGLRALHDADC